MTALVRKKNVVHMLGKITLYNGGGGGAVICS